MGPKRLVELVSGLVSEVQGLRLDVRESAARHTDRIVELTTRVERLEGKFQEANFCPFPDCPRRLSVAGGRG